MYRLNEGQLQVLLVHPGGPFFRNRDEGSWTIPKGEFEPGETPLDAAIREFAEETGLQPSGPYIELGSVKQRGGKIVHAWAFEGDCDPQRILSNAFSMEWPRGSGRIREFPEIDRAEFYSLDRAKEKINPAQAALIVELETKLESS